jgi:hypothetical protein
LIIKLQRPPFWWALLVLAYQKDNRRVFRDGRAVVEFIGGQLVGGVPGVVVVGATAGSVAFAHSDEGRLHHRLWRHLLDGRRQERAEFVALMR